MNKKKYKIKNWNKYNSSLIGRGDISIWIEDKSLKEWLYKKSKKTYSFGRPKIYSDLAIELILTLKCLFKMPLRSSQGFVLGLFKMLNIQLPVPNYSSLSRRAKKLNIKLKTNITKNMDIVIDSTGLKVYGEGEWKVRMHGISKRRTWRKLHVAIDPKSHLAISTKLTLSKVGDATALVDLVGHFKNIKTAYADGAYAAHHCFDTLDRTGARVLIPPPLGAKLTPGKTPGEKQKNKNVQQMNYWGGRSQWKKQSGYHQRSLVETHMFRFKKIFGDTLSSKTLENQITETMIKTNALNKMTKLGMPKTISVEY